MKTNSQTHLNQATTTSYGGENITDFRVTKATAASNTGRATKQSAALAKANAWLLANSGKVDAHAKASTKRLIGQDSV